MSVLETSQIDYVYFEDDTQTPVLVVSDPLPWAPGDATPHLDALREKLNTQIAFVETGQMLGVWPDYAGGVVKVEVVARHAMAPEAEAFFGLAQQMMMQQSNIRLDFHLCRN